MREDWPIVNIDSCTQLVFTGLKKCHCYRKEKQNSMRKICEKRDYLLLFLLHNKFCLMYVYKIIGMQKLLFRGALYCETQKQAPSIFALPYSRRPDYRPVHQRRPEQSKLFSGRNPGNSLDCSGGWISRQTTKQFWEESSSWRSCSLGWASPGAVIGKISSGFCDSVTAYGEIKNEKILKIILLSVTGTGRPRVLFGRY